MDVAYLSNYYTADCTRKGARFHDWIHALREMDEPPFDAKVHSYVVWEEDELVYSEPPHYLDTAESLYPSAKNQPEGILNVPRIWRDLREHDPDVVHAVSINLPILLILKSINLDADLVIGPNIGGWNPVRPNELWLDNPVEGVKNKWRYNLNKSNLEFLDVANFFSFSNYHKKMLTTYGIPEEHIIPLRPGVDPLFHPMDSDTNENDMIKLLFIGWFDNNHKGYELFLRALSRVDNQVLARIFGRGDPRRELIEELGLGERVTIEGFIPRKELPEVYNVSDLTVVPYTDEMGPNAQIESLACGTPVVTTDELGLNEYPDSESAVFFKPRSPEALASAIREAIHELPAMTEYARENAKKFSIETTVKQLSNIYSNI